MADFQINLSANGTADVTKQLSAVLKNLENLTKQVSSLTQNFDTASTSSTEFGKSTKSAATNVDQLASAVTDSSKSMSTAADEALNVTDSYEKLSSSVVEARQEFEKINADIASISSSVGEGSLALETLSNALGTSNSATRSFVDNIIELDNSVDRIAESLQASRDEVLTFIDQVDKGKIAVEKISTSLNVTAADAEEFGLQMQNDSAILAVVASKMQITTDEARALSEEVTDGVNAWGSLTDGVYKAGLSWGEFQVQMDKSNASLSRIAEVSDLAEDEIKKLALSVKNGEQSLKELADQMGISEDKAKALISAYNDSLYSFDKLTTATQSLADSYLVVDKALSSSVASIDSAGDSLKSLSGDSDDASQSVEDMSDDVGGSADQIAEGMVLITEGAQNAFGSLTELASTAIQTFAEFDDALRATAAIGAFTNTEMGQLTDKVIELGIETSATPLEISKLTTELARAGYTANEQTAALEGIIRASEATGEGLTDVGAIIGQVIRTFSLSASESLTVADSLVAAANSTSASVTSLGEGFAYVGSQAVLSNQSVNEVITALALLSDVGLEGSIGGTSLAEALRRLSLASAGANSEFNDLVRGQEKMVNAFGELGVKIRDSNGQLLPMTQLLPILAEQFNKLSSQEDKEIIASALFGVQGGRSFLALLEQVDTRLVTVNDSIVNSGGVAKATGEVMLQGLGGSFKLLQSSVDTLMIGIGEFASQALDPLIKAATSLINGFLDLPPAVKNVVFTMGTLYAAVNAAVLVMAAYEALQVKAAVASVAAASARLKETAANFLAGKSMDALAASSINASRSLLALDVGMAKAAVSAKVAGASVAGTGAAMTATAGATAGATGALATFGTAVKSFAVLVGSGLAVLLPFAAAIGSVGLGAKVALNLTGVTGPIKEVTNGIESMNEAFEEYQKVTGNFIQKTEQQKNAFQFLKEEVDKTVNTITTFFYTWKLLPGMMSMAEAEASGLTVQWGNMQVTLNSLNSDFLKYAQANELASDAAQALIPALEAAKAAISLLQAEGAKNVETSPDQLLAWQQQQQELTGLIDKLKGAADAVKAKAAAAAAAAEEIKEAYEKIGPALESSLNKLDIALANALTKVNNDVLLSAEERETAVANVESEFLQKRLEALEQSLQQRKALSGLEKQDEIKNIEEIEQLEVETAQVRLQIAETFAQQRGEAEKELAEQLKEVEKERLEAEKALREEAFNRDIRQIDLLTQAAKQAAQERIDAENQVLEALDDQSTAISNQLALLEIQQSNESAVSAAQIARYDRQIEDLGKVAGYLDIVNDKESSLVEKQLAKNELQRIGISQDSDLNNLIFNREQRLDIVNTLLQTGIDKRNKEISLQDLIIYNEEKKRQAEKSALLARQEGEQKVLGLQQEQQRIELQRQVSQAKIAEIEAQSLITQTELKIKGEERLLTFKKMELAAAQAEGASKSELIALQGQVDAQNTALQLAQSELPLAQEQANLAGQQLADARDAVIAGENLFKAQSDQLGISQDLERKALETANHGERLATALGDSTGGAAGTADELERAAGAAERTAAAVEATVSATESLSRLQGKSIPGPGSLGRVEEFNKRAEEAGEALENLPRLRTRTTTVSGGGNDYSKTSYFIGNREVSESDYNKEIQAREDLRKLANTRLGGEISAPLSPVNDSYAALKDTVESLERFQQNSRNLARSIGLPTMVTVPKGSDRELEERLAKSPAGVALAKWEEELRNFFTNYKDQSLALTDELLAEETAKVEAARDAARKKAMTDNSQQTQDEVEEFTRKWDILTQINTDRLAEQQRQEAAAARVRAEEEAAIRREVTQIEGDKLTADQIKAEKDLLEFRIANEQSLKGWELDRVNARLAALKQVEETIDRISRKSQVETAYTTAFPGRAIGGPVWAGRPYLVGEKGVELFVPDENGQIIPNDKLNVISPGRSLPSIGVSSTAPSVPLSSAVSIAAKNRDTVKVSGEKLLSPTLSNAHRNAIGLEVNLSRIETLVQEIANRPIPQISSNTTFVNQPNPIQAQVELLQGQLRAARGAI